MGRYAKRWTDTEDYGRIMKELEVYGMHWKELKATQKCYMYVVRVIVILICQMRVLFITAVTFILC